ncbi:hypothetical protein [Borreliella tanukii]|uniref:hypothetical protein n=1 Tax=Borreliella tanukii TaxID=56146 RepID=UPI002649C957|nr:hypothetical protein [Borreliella tanukii]WKC79599.1 hypothetical protein QIA28_01445 [Borreliella tanukii]WKC80519.1 hypothetical protein QIA29_01430 [Borreliella tanukii]WKC81432.1 hypothetical protein QIA27_01430 [Borreliella tanukii]WKC82349.1 hypothetical protein QIA26_01425 [Borreliella tanukii]
MQLVSLNNIEKQESFIHYRNVYFADVVYKYNDVLETKKVKFVIEATPLGEKHVTIDFVDPLNYPVLKLMVAIKRRVIDLEFKGKLS